MSNSKVICVVGPTATGKTELAIKIATRYHGEVVSADSMQIYRGMDIGTAKPTRQDRQAIPHHMIDVVDPTEKYSVSRYIEEAAVCIDDILHRGYMPIIAGGTGLYIRSLIEGIYFSGGGGDEPYRDELIKYAEQNGNEALHHLLLEIDAETAGRLHVNDKTRIIRALELFRQTGIKMSEHIVNTKKMKPRFDALFIGVNYTDRTQLYTKIDERVDMMLEQGFVSEVQRLAEVLNVRNSTAMQAIGYREILKYLEGEITIQQATEEMKRQSRRYAKRQMTWFRSDKRIHWFTIAPGKTIADYHIEIFALADTAIDS